MADSKDKTGGPIIPMGQSYVRATDSDLKLEKGFYGDRFPTGGDPAGNAPVAPAYDQQLMPPGYLKLVWFGKMHYVSPGVYARDAERFNDLHWKEAWLRVEELSALQGYYREWAYPTRFVDYWVSKTGEKWSGTRDWARSFFVAVESVPKPDPGEFHDLVMRTYGIIEKIQDSKLDPRRLARNGLDLSLVYEDSKRLNAAVSVYRDGALKSADEVTKGLESVESCSFQILYLVPTLTFMDPIREAIYKIGVMMLQAGARGAGGWISSDSKDYNDKWMAARREILAILKQKVPELIADVVMIPVNKYLAATKYSGFSKKSVVVFIRNSVEFIGDFVWLIAENGGKALTEEQFDALIRKRLEALVASVLSEIPGLSANIKDTLGKTIIKSVVDNVIRVLFSEFLTIRETLKTGDKTISEALWADLPTLIMKVVEGVLMGILQRRAAQSGLMTEQAMRGQERTNYSEAWKVAHQDGLGWVKGKAPRGSVADLKKARSKLPPYTTQDHEQRWKLAPVMTEEGKEVRLDSINIERQTAANLEAYAHNNNAIMLFSNPNKWRPMHMANAESLGAKGQKPVYCKGKTADSGEMGENDGLVFKPTETSDGKRTHKDMQKARDTWFGKDDKGHQNDTVFHQNGGMIREDGLAFHPDQLKRWGTLRPEHRADCAEAIKTLHELQKRGICDLNDEGNKAKVLELVKDGTLTQDQVDRTAATLKAAKIGFISDVDIAGVWDAKTGEIVPMGREAKTFSLEDANRQQANAEVNADNAAENLAIHPDLAKLKTPDGILGGKAYKPIARPGDPHQHGTFAESGYDLFGEIAFVGPNREVFLIRSRLTASQAEEKGGSRSKPGDPEWMVQQRGHFLDLKEQVDAFFKDRYGIIKSPFDAVLDAKRELPDMTKALRPRAKGTKPPNVSTPKIEQVLDMHAGVEIVDEKGLGVPADELDVSNSLIHRNLSIEDYYIRKFAGEWTYAQAQERKVVLPRPDAVADARQKYDTFLGVDPNFANLVIAVIHYRQTLGEAIAALLRTRRALGPVWPIAEDGTNRTVWYEIYSAFTPVSIDHVRSRVGKPATGIPGNYTDLKVDGAWPATCYDTPAEKALKDARLYAFATGGFRSSYTPDAKRYGPFLGFQLLDVWETKSYQLLYRPTKNADTFFTFFPSAPVDATGLVKPSRRAVPAKK